MADEPWLLGVEIGGTKLQLGLSRRPESIEFLRRSTILPGRGASGIRDQIREGFALLLAESGLAAGDVRAAGIGFGGPVDAEAGVTETSFQVDGWGGFPLAAWTQESLGVGVVSVHNDADVAGLAESRLGAGAGLSPLLYLTIGSGIGGALILDGRIYRGAGLGAAEIGHLRVPNSGPSAGEPPELESVASGWGIGRAAREEAAALERRGVRWEILDGVGDASRLSAVDVALAAERGDALAQDILSRAREAMAFALCQAAALVAPRRIILGGGVSLIGDRLWFDPIRELVDARVFRPFRGSFDILPASLGEEVVVHGALVLAREALASVR